jgi:hypothetical protein
LVKFEQNKKSKKQKQNKQTKTHAELNAKHNGPSLKAKVESGAKQE